MSEEKQLKAYTDVNDVDTIVAYSPEDAYKVWEEHVGSGYKYEVGKDAEWCELPTGQLLTITFEDVADEVIPEGATVEPYGEYGKRVTATVTEWIKAQWRCFLCSTEW